MAILKRSLAIQCERPGRWCPRTGWSRPGDGGGGRQTRRGLGAWGWKQFGRDPLRSVSLQLLADRQAQTLRLGGEPTHKGRGSWCGDSGVETGVQLRAQGPVCKGWPVSLTGCFANSSHLRFSILNSKSCAFLVAQAGVPLGLGRVWVARLHCCG